MIFIVAKNVQWAEAYARELELSKSRWRYVYAPQHFKGLVSGEIHLAEKFYTNVNWPEIRRELIVIKHRKPDIKIVGGPL